MRLAQSTCNLAPHVGDYGLETNRRVFFSSPCGELGMPIYCSSGYDWESAMDIWFDSIASGTLGSLHCFDGDENSEKHTATHIAKFNGINRAVLLALRLHQFDSKRTPTQYKDILHTNIMITLASLTDDSSAEADHIGIVPFNDGQYAIKNKHTSANIILAYKLLKHR